MKDDGMVDKFIDNSALVFVMNEFFMKENYEYLLQQMAKLIQNRVSVMNHRELTRKKNGTYFFWNTNLTEWQS